MKYKEYKVEGVIISGRKSFEEWERISSLKSTDKQGVLFSDSLEGLKKAITEYIDLLNK